MLSDWPANPEKKSTLCAKTGCHFSSHCNFLRIKSKLHHLSIPLPLISMFFCILTSQNIVGNNVYCKYTECITYYSPIFNCRGGGGGKIKTFNISSCFVHTLESGIDWPSRLLYFQKFFGKLQYFHHPPRKSAQRSKSGRSSWTTIDSFYFFYILHKVRDNQGV